MCVLGGGACAYYNIGMVKELKPVNIRQTCVCIHTCMHAHMNVHTQTQTSCQVFNEIKVITQ